MTPDKALEEIRAVRQQISETYGHDVKAFLEHYRELERQYQERDRKSTRLNSSH